MAGFVLSIIPPMLFDWTQITSAQAQIIHVARRIDLSQYEQAALQIRLHTVTVNAADSFTVTVAGDGYTNDDPGRDYGQVGTTLASQNYQAGTITAPTFTVVALATIGTFVGSAGLARISVSGTHGVAAGTTFQVLMSMDLAVKTAAGGPNLGSMRMPRVYYGYGYMAP